MNVKLPKIKKNFFWIALVFFFVWLLFFDSNDLVSQAKSYLGLRKLEDKKQYYEEKIIEIEDDIKSLRTNPKQLEKFAREKYLMRKKSEDVYLIEVEKEK
ncbi:MAG: septum formation initiator family protein [Cyclobacteriaceae bacterium]